MSNTIFLALEDPTKNSSEISLEEKVFIYIYTVECAIKIIGLGLVANKGAYLKDKANILDIIIVITGWVEILLQNGIVNLSALRTLRILRPIRSIKSIKGLRILFMSLIECFKMLLSTIAILLIFFLIFSITGLQL